jgi:hypothetical protein
MKKTIALAMAILALALAATGCSSGGGGGTVTDLSGKYLAKGYIVNMYRSMTPLGSDAASLGKAYATVSYDILADYTSTLIPTAGSSDLIKKVVVSNVRVASTSKKGIAQDLMIMEAYAAYPIGAHVDVVGTKTSYEYTYPQPTTYGFQAHVGVTLAQVALYDETTSPMAKGGQQVSWAGMCSELGIATSDVTLTIAFRIELVTVGGKTLYKDYEVVVPPAGADIAGSEYHFDRTVSDTAQMQPFLEK